MPRLSPDPSEADLPAHVCVRCSKPITPGGIALQLAGHPVHIRCFAQAMQLEMTAQRVLSALKRLRARAARKRAVKLVGMVHHTQTTCPVCGERLATRHGVLFQGDLLVHAACWRADSKPFDAPPPVG